LEGIQLRDELLEYLNKRLSHLRKRKLSHIIEVLRAKNKGRIEEVENLIDRIKTGNFKNSERD